MPFVDVVRPQGKLVVAVADAMMPRVAKIDQAVVAHPAIGVNDRWQIGMAANHGPQRGFCDIGNNLGVDLVIAFEQTEHDGLGAGSSSAFAAHAPRAEVGLIGFEVALERRMTRAFFSHPLAQTEKDWVDAAHRQPGHLSRLRGRQIQSKTAQENTKFGLGNLRKTKYRSTPAIAVA